MRGYLYRYIPFETLVGMVQSKSLTFVLPELWDDPKECVIFKYYVDQQDNLCEKLALWSVYNKTFCQCWTTLAESDAMWRIYSYNDRAIRIKISRESVNLLDNVQAIDIEYLDDLEHGIPTEKNAYLKTFSLKRTAFAHEKEVRLVKHYQFSDDEDFYQHMYAWLAISEHPDRIKILESHFPGKSLEEKIDSVVKLLNIGNCTKKTMDISFDHIPDFISGVLIHPLAPEWYVHIVREFCIRNTIPFEGKSTLYSK